MATVTATPSTGTAVVTFFRATCDDVPANTATGYDTDNYPASPAVECYFKLSKSGEDDLISNIFSTNAEGSAEWNGILIPAAGTWALAVLNASDDSTIATTNVVVS